MVLTQFVFLCVAAGRALQILSTSKRGVHPQETQTTPNQIPGQVKKKKGIKSKSIPNCDMRKEDGRRPGRRRGNKQQREGSDRKTFNKSLNEKTSTEQND